MSILLERSDLPKALEVVNSWNPEGSTYLVQGLLSGEIMTNVGFHFWVDKWPDFTFILLVGGPNYKYTFMANVVSFASTDPRNLKELLLASKPLKEKKDVMFGNFPGNQEGVLKELVDIWKAKILFCSKTQLFTTNAKELKSYDLPESYTSCELTLDDAEIMKANWSFAGKGSLKFIESHIENFPALGVKDEKGNLVAWELSYFTGAMGMLHVLEEHRKKGIAKFIICTLARKLLSLGRNVYCFIENDNPSSIDLHLKVGFYSPPGSNGFFTKLIKGVNEENDNGPHE